MKKFYKDLKENAIKIVNYEKKNDTINKLRKKIHLKPKVFYICKKGFNADDEKYQKVRGHCHYTGKYRGAAHNICNLRYKIQKEIPVVFHNGSTYDIKVY